MADNIVFNADIRCMEFDFLSVVQNYKSRSILLGILCQNQVKHVRNNIKRLYVVICVAFIFVPLDTYIFKQQSNLAKFALKHTIRV